MFRIAVVVSYTGSVREFGFINRRPEWFDSTEEQLLSSTVVPIANRIMRPRLRCGRSGSDSH